MVEPAGEFETIRDLLAPLAHPEWGRGLADDAAILPARPGQDLVLTKDALVEGVHFLADDPLDTVAQKLLRVNLSDLAAKGAEPFGYLLACGWSPRCDWPMRAAFAEGLARDQAAFGVHLMGGDTVVTPGPAVFSLTALGWTPRGRMVGRAGARPGHAVYVTGTIGDGRLGLDAARGRLNLAPERLEALIEHYRRPMPRVGFAGPVRDLASACLDVSDGLIADLGHMARASDVGIEIDLDILPLSGAAQAWLAGRADPEAALIELATGGDDYELALAVPVVSEAALRREAELRHLRLTCLGRVVEGTGVTASVAGRPVDIPIPGWTHR